jgi:hypothetical protein
VQSRYMPSVRSEPLTLTILLDTVPIAATTRVGCAEASTTSGAPNPAKISRMTVFKFALPRQDWSGSLKTGTILVPKEGTEGGFVSRRCGPY